MLQDCEIAWLAGFVDADGSIRLKKGAKNQKKGQNSLIPHITFHNTCALTLSEIEKLILKVIPTFTVGMRKRSSIHHAPCAGIEIYGMKRAEPILRMLEPFLITKKLEAQLVIKFIENRKSRENRNKPYESIDYRINEALKYLKKTRHLRDYMPSIDEILNEDIVRTSAKALEEAEMSSRLSESERKDFAATLVWYRKDRSKGIHHSEVTTQDG